jgi:hypothetical protein
MVQMLPILQEPPTPLYIDMAQQAKMFEIGIRTDLYHKKNGSAVTKKR